LRKKIPKNPVDLICQSVAFMKYWAHGADALLNLAMGPAARRNDAAGNTSGVRRLAGRSEGDMEVDDDPEDADHLGA
jgi:hypothetical protein